MSVNKLGNIIDSENRFPHLKTVTMDRFFHHEYEHVEGYLHHRRPYLLIDRIVEILDRSVTTEMTVATQAGFDQGHFPGAAIFPGALMQELSTQSAGVLIAARYNPMETFDTSDPMFNEYALGVLVKVEKAKFRGFARPGDVLHTHVTLQEVVGNVFDFSAEIRCGDKRIMKNQFQLINIPSATLRGV